MTLSLTLAFLWLFAANVLAMLPSRDNLWRRAYVLLALGGPLLVFVAVQNGPWVALLVLAAMASVLRWPLRYALRWTLSKVSS